MEGLWQETAAGPGELGWDTGACGQGRAVPWDGSTQGMPSAQQTPWLLSLRGWGARVSLGSSPRAVCITKCHTSWPDEMAFGRGMQHGSPGWRDGHGLGVCSLRQQTLCAFVPSSVGSARTCLWARAVIKWSPRYPHTLGVTSLPQAREAEWGGLRALPAAKSHPSLLHVAIVVYGGFICLQIRNVWVPSHQ